MKRTVVIVATGLLLAFQGACEGGGPGSYMSIGTGGTGGIYYPVGGALASMLSSRFPDRQFTAEVTAASVENVTRLQQGQIDLGMAITITILSAYEGTAEVNEPFQDLRIVAPLWPNPVNVLIPEGSEIDDFGDVRDERLGVGAPGSGTEQVSRALLDAYGMTYEDVEERFLSFSESSAGIRDGSLDAAILEVAHPAAAVMEATTTGNAQLLSLEGPEIDGLLEEHPGFFRYTIPAGAYRGVDRDVATIAELNWVIAPESLDPEVVTAVLDILQNQRDRLVEVNGIVRQIDLQRLQDPPIPLHPATRQWVEENLTGSGAEAHSPAEATLEPALAQGSTR